MSEYIFSSLEQEASTMISKVAEYVLMGQPFNPAKVRCHSGGGILVTGMALFHPTRLLFRLTPG